MNSLKFNEFQPSVFAQMVDKLRDKSEAELKMLYLRFFQKDSSPATLVSSTFTLALIKLAMVTKFLK